jgi:DNA-binding NarL/FixJ family response regulator
MKQASFILFDNQDITKIGMHCFLQKYFPTEEMHDVDTKKDLQALLHRDSNRIVVLDYTLADFHDVWELFNMSQRYTATQWIIFSEELSRDFVNRIYASSENISILLKDAPFDECKLAIEESIRGERYFNENLIHNSPEADETSTECDDKKVLSDTEQTILRLMALGKTTKEIAMEKNLSFHTINTHRKNIFHKLQVNNLHEATKYALRAGILSVAEYMI